MYNLVDQPSFKLRSVFFILPTYDFLNSHGPWSYKPSPLICINWVCSRFKMNEAWMGKTPVISDHKRRCFFCNRCLLYHFSEGKTIKSKQEDVKHHVLRWCNGIDYIILILKKHRLSCMILEVSYVMPEFLAVCLVLKPRETHRSFKPCRFANFKLPII